MQVIGRMPISDYQIANVVRAYIKNMKVRAEQIEESLGDNSCEYELNISREGLKKMMYERIGGQMAEKLKNNGQGER